MVTGRCSRHSPNENHFTTRHELQESFTYVSLINKSSKYVSRTRWVIYTSVSVSCHSPNESHFNTCHELQESFTYVSLIQYVIEIRVTNSMSHLYICQCVVSITWTSHVTYMNESCHTYEWVMFHMVQDLSGHGSRFVRQRGEDSESTSEP